MTYQKNDAASELSLRRAALRPHAARLSTGASRSHAGVEGGMSCASTRSDETKTATAQSIADLMQTSPRTIAL